MLKLGLESGDQGVLDALEKGIRVDEASQALKALKGAGIGTYAYLLFGTPAESPAAAQRTLEFAARHAGVIDFLNLAIFNLPAGSGEAASLRVHPFSEGDLSLYVDFDHPGGVGQTGGAGLSGQEVSPTPRRFAHRAAPTAVFHIQSCPVYAKFLLKISEKDYRV